MEILEQIESRCKAVQEKLKVINGLRLKPDYDDESMFAIKVSQMHFEVRQEISELLFLAKGRDNVLSTELRKIILVEIDLSEEQAKNEKVSAEERKLIAEQVFNLKKRLQLTYLH